MAELEALRKRATTPSTPAPKPRKEREVVIPDFGDLTSRRDVARTLHLSVPAEARKARSIRVTVSFPDGEGEVTQDQTVEVGDLSDVGNLSVNLKIDLA